MSETDSKVKLVVAKDNNLWGWGEWAGELCPLTSVSATPGNSDQTGDQLIYFLHKKHINLFGDVFQYLILF